VSGGQDDRLELAVNAELGEEVLLSLSIRRLELMVRWKAEAFRYDAF
jgi:hypothetical protein